MLQNLLAKYLKVLPRRVNPTCRSGRFRSDPHRISSESDIFHKKPIGSDRVFVGFLSVGFRSKLFRSDGIRSPLSHMGSDNIVILYKRSGIYPRRMIKIIVNHLLSFETILTGSKSSRITDSFEHYPYKL